MVSTATRERGSLPSSASRMASLIASQILSGCPSVTDSDVNSLEDPLTTRSYDSLTTCPTKRLRVRHRSRLSVEQRDHRIPHLGRQLRLRPESDRPFRAVDRQQPAGVVLRLEGLPLADRVDHQ